jgi:hypothetical protein
MFKRLLQNSLLPFPDPCTKVEPGAVEWPFNLELAHGPLLLLVKCLADDKQLNCLSSSMIDVQVVVMLQS